MSKYVTTIVDNENNETYKIRDAEAVVSGSNDNGYYIKFSDGTMICTKTVTATIDCSSTWGSLYVSGYTSLGSFAETFIETPVVHIDRNGGAEWWIINNYVPSTTSVGSVQIARGTTSSSVAATFYITAIGRWKD